MFKLTLQFLALTGNERKKWASPRMEYAKQETVTRLGRTFRELTVPIVDDDIPSEMSRLLARLRELEAQHVRTTRPTAAGTQ
jgi:hypothetical protein